VIWVPFCACSFLVRSIVHTGFPHIGYPRQCWFAFVMDAGLGCCAGTAERVTDGTALFVTSRAIRTCLRYHPFPYSTSHTAFLAFVLCASYSPAPSSLVLSCLPRGLWCAHGGTSIVTDGPGLNVVRDACYHRRTDILVCLAYLPRHFAAHVPAYRRLHCSTLRFRCW